MPILGSSYFIPGGPHLNINSVSSRDLENEERVVVLVSTVGLGQLCQCFKGLISHFQDKWYIFQLLVFCFVQILV